MKRIVQAVRNRKWRWGVGLSVVVFLACGAAARSNLLYGLGAAGLCWLALRSWRGYRARSRGGADSPADQGPSPDESVAAPLDPNDLGSLVEGMFAQRRYALLLRRQLVSNLTPQQFQRARDALERQMALVPAGNVSLGQIHGADSDDEGTEAAADTRRVEAMFLDRYTVTNRQYFAFVEAGGYEQMSIWDPQIWTAVFDFTDATGAPGPRFWKHGKFPRGEEDFPVVGVSWYEAAAYARWVGKRLPTEAEWFKAGSWPVPLSDHKQWQRKFPWGDTMDRERCNLWGSGPGKAVAVGEFSSGVSVGGVYQLIGNVWEWTSGNFGSAEAERQDLILPAPMKSIRGGAFDTYFENQATCQFQSGESPLSRKHNIGFRCALGLCDVASPEPAEPAAQSEPTEGPEAPDEFQESAIQAEGASA